MRVNKMATLLLIVLCLYFCQSKGSGCKCDITIKINSNGTDRMSHFSVCGNGTSINMIDIPVPNSSTLTCNWKCNDCLHNCRMCQTNSQPSTIITASCNKSDISPCTTVHTYTTSPASVLLNNNTETIKYVSLVALGSAVGVLVLLLAVVTIGWIWTCCVMKKRRKLTINSNKNR